jgi:C-terminal processing protease CtpA/Prc
MRVIELFAILAVVGCSTSPHHVKTADQSDLSLLLSDVRLGAYPSEAKKEAYVVTSLELGSPWETVGLEEGDVILKVDGRSVLESQAYLDLFRAVARPGTIPIEILRQGEYLILPTVAEKTQ